MDIFRSKTMIRASDVYRNIRALVKMMMRYENFIIKYIDTMHFLCQPYYNHSLWSNYCVALFDTRKIVIGGYNEWLIVRIADDPHFSVGVTLPPLDLDRPYNAPAEDNFYLCKKCKYPIVAVRYEIGCDFAVVADILVHDFYPVRDPTNHLTERIMICQNCHSRLTFLTPEIELAHLHDVPDYIVFLDPQALVTGGLKRYEECRVLMRNNPDVDDVLVSTNTEHTPMDVVEDENEGSDHDADVISIDDSDDELHEDEMEKDEYVIHEISSDEDEMEEDESVIYEISSDSDVEDDDTTDLFGF